MNILVLSNGNVARGPLCELVLYKELVELNPRRFVIGLESAGFRDGGKKAAKRVQQVAHEMGYDMWFCRSTRITGPLLFWADLVVSMDNLVDYKLYELMDDAEMSLGHRRVVRLPSFCDGIRRVPEMTTLPPESHSIRAVADLVIESSKALAACILSGELDCQRPAEAAVSSAP